MLKKTGKKILSYSLGVFTYEWLIISVYPTIAKSPAIAEIPKSFPNSIKSVFGVPPDSGYSFEAYISAQFLGRILTLLMAIYGVSTANELVSKLVEQGSMAYLLSVPATRLEIITSQIAVLLTGLAVMVTSVLLGIYTASHKFDVKIKRWNYFRFGLLGYSFFAAISSYCLFFSALFNDSERAILLGTSLTFLFFSLDVVSGLNERFAWVQKLTLFGLYRPQKVLEGSMPTWPFFISTGITTAMFILTSLIFEKKDIPV